MARKPHNPNFEQTLDLLRAHSFDVAPYAGVAGSALASKYGVGAVLAPAKDHPAFVERPGVLIKGEVARLVDRGYQKFIVTSKHELPATAAQLEAIHRFSEELKQLTGEISLYNESLGSTNDLHLYDRLKGREVEEPQPELPWEAAAGH
jgi:hypothetical protein